MALDPLRRPSMISPVSPRRWTGRPPGRPKGPRREQLTVFLEPRQARALRRLALAVAKARGGTRPDVSAVLRELLDEALAARRTR